MNIRSNDTIVVLGGRERGKQGKVQRVLPKEGRVVVEGVNFVKRHTKPGPQMRQAGIVQKEAPLPISRVMLVCPHCSKPTRASMTFLNVSGQQTKARVCKQCHEVIDQTT